MRIRNPSNSKGDPGGGPREEHADCEMAGHIGAEELPGGARRESSPLIIGCRAPAKMLVTDTETGKQTASIDIVGDTRRSLLPTLRPTECTRDRRLSCSEMQTDSPENTTRSLRLCRTPVQQDRDRCVRGRFADNQKPPVGCDVPTHRPRADSGIDDVGLEQRVRVTGLEYGRGANIHRHHLRIGRNVEQLFSIAAPAWHPPA